MEREEMTPFESPYYPGNLQSVSFAGITEQNYALNSDAWDLR